MVLNVKINIDIFIYNLDASIYIHILFVCLSTMTEIISINARINFVTRLIELTECESKDPSSIVKKSK